MISVETARSLVAERIRPLGVETVPSITAVGRVLAADAVSTTSLPPFDQSGMDGYAVRAADLDAACEEAPVALPIADRVAAGPGAPAELGPGACARIFTGAPVPLGADAVVPQERVHADGTVARFSASTVPGDCMRATGADFATADTIARCGVRVRPGTVAALAAAGIASVPVRVLPRVTVIVTGNELVPLGQPLGPGQVYDCNAPMVAAWFAARGLAATIVRAPDDREETTALLDRAFAESDLVVSTGGVSVGDHDHIVPAAQTTGAEQVFWKVAQKPGKPLLFAVREGVPLLGLPGNPAAVFVGLDVFVDGALRALAGQSPRALEPMACDALPTPRDRALWVRGSITRDGDMTRFVPRAAQASFRVGDLGDVDGFAYVTVGSAAGAVAHVLRVGGD